MFGFVCLGLLAGSSTFFRGYSMLCFRTCEVSDTFDFYFAVSDFNFSSSFIEPWQSIGLRARENARNETEYFDA